MRNLSKKAKTIIAGAAIAGLASTGVAYAYWTTTGTGSGTAGTGTTLNVTVNQLTSPSALSPGTSGPLTGNITNHDAAASPSITSVTAVVDTFKVLGDGVNPPCTQADFAITGSTGSVGVVPGGATANPWSDLTLSMVDGGANQDNCKSVSVPITYTAHVS